MVVVGGANRRFVRSITMVVIGIILCLVGFAYVCWLLFTLAVYALPFFAGVTAGLAVYRSGSGPVTAIIVGTTIASITLVFGQVAFATLRSPVMRVVLALLFAIPAAIAGYHVTHAFLHLLLPAAPWRDAIAIAGATIVAVTSAVRVSISSRPEVGQVVAAGLTPPLRAPDAKEA
jgi:hypothetical protein